MARLIHTYNNKIISNHAIVPGQELIIGRDPESKIHIDHPAVSHHHVKVGPIKMQIHRTLLSSSPHM